MRHISRLALFSSVFSLALLVACGGSDSPAVPGVQAATASGGSGSDVAPDAAALVPVDADIVARVSSIDRLDEIVAEIGNAMKKPMPGSLVMQVAMMSGVDPKLIDTTRPAMVAVRLPEGAPRPLITFILPVSDPSKVDAKATRGGYVAVTRDPGYKEGGSKLTDALPAGDYVMRVDLGRLLERYRPMIDRMIQRSGLGAAALPGLEKVRNDLVGSAKSVLDSVERFDFALSEQDGRLDLAAAVTVRPGSPLADCESVSSGLADLASRLDRDYPLVALVTLDLGNMVDAVETLAKQWAQGVAEKQRAAGLALVKELDREWLIAAGVEKKLRLVAAFKTKGPAVDFLNRYVVLASEHQGATVKVGEAREVHGATVRRLSVTVDVARQAKATGKSAEAIKKKIDSLFGGETFTVDLAARGHDLLITVGTKVDGLLAEHEMPAGIKKAVGRARGDLRFLLYLDLRALLRGAQQMGMTGLPPVNDGDPVVVDVYASTEGNVYRAGASVNLRDIATLR